MRGRKPTPTSLRVLRGNPGKRPYNGDEPEPAVVLPDPPSDLDATGLEEWHRTGDILQRLGVLTEADVPAFAAYCRAWARYLDAEKKCSAMGEVLKAPSGYPIVNPLRSISNKALTQCQQFWAEFGMMPSSRSRVRVSKGSARPASKLDRFLKKA